MINIKYTKQEIKNQKLIIKLSKKLKTLIDKGSSDVDYMLDNMIEGSEYRIKEGCYYKPDPYIEPTKPKYIYPRLVVRQQTTGVAQFDGELDDDELVLM